MEGSSGTAFFFDGEGITSLTPSSKTGRQAESASIGQYFPRSSASGLVSVTMPRRPSVDGKGLEFLFRDYSHFVKYFYIILYFKPYR